MLDKTPASTTSQASPRRRARKTPFCEANAAKSTAPLHITTQRQRGREGTGGGKRDAMDRAAGLLTVALDTRRPAAVEGADNETLVVFVRIAGAQVLLSAL